MNSSMSTLNPYATSYVPISKRDESKEDKHYNTPPKESHPSTDDYKLKGQQIEVADGVSSEISHDADSKFVDEESEMDLAYLQMMFPGISDQSLADVYTVNRGDLDAAVDMLTHLESADNLSDALGGEQAEESVSSGECSSVKDVNVMGESTSSFPTASAVAT